MTKLINRLDVVSSSFFSVFDFMFISMNDQFESMKIIFLYKKFNKQIMIVMSRYLIINWVMFEFTIFDSIIICFLFKLKQPKHDTRTRIAIPRASWLDHHHPMYLKGKIKDINSDYMLIITIKMQLLSSNI